MGSRVDHPAAPLLVSVEYHQYIGKWWVRNDPGGAQRIGAMNEQITESHLGRHTRNVVVPVRAPQAFHEFGYWLASECSGQSVNGTIWP